MRLNLGGESFRPNTFIFATATCVALALAASQANAAMVYGNFSGDTVDYIAVTEDTNTGDTLPLFGAPTVSGDSLDFDPVGFSASSSGGGAPDFTDGQLSFMIEAKSGNVINSLLLTEAGDTSLGRGLGSLDDAETEVTADIFIDILEVDGVPINQINVSGAMTFTPSSGSYSLSGDGGGSSAFQTSWTGSYFVDFLPVLTANGITGDVTKVSVNLDNTLRAASATGSSAFIAKKDFDGGVNITPNPDQNMIPEPATVTLAALGMLAFAGWRRVR